MTNETQETGDSDETTDLGDFVHQLSTWHTRKVDNLRSIQESIKEGTILKVGEDDEGSPMTATAVAYFKAGMEAVLMELGTLPFTVSEPQVDS